MSAARDYLRARFSQHAALTAAPAAAPGAVWDPLNNPSDPLIRLDLRHPGSFDALVAPHDACILNGAEGRGKCVRPPRDGDGYRYAMSGGSKAVIPMGLPHADIRLPVSAAIQHYADTGYAAAIVSYSEDAAGNIWAKGDLVPDLSERDRVVIAAAALSGDWRWIEEERRYRMIASQIVNTPGFRPAYAGERQFAMAASAGALITSWEPVDWRGEILAQIRGQEIDSSMRSALIAAITRAPAEQSESKIVDALLAAIRRVPAGSRAGGQFAPGPRSDSSGSSSAGGGFSIDDMPDEEGLEAYFAGTEYANALVGQQQVAWAYQQTGFDKTLPERVDYPGEMFERSDVEFVVHRGIGDSVAHNADAFHDRLLDGEHYVGAGRYGMGTYTSTSAGEARAYARMGDIGGGTMTTVGIKKGARIVDYRDTDQRLDGSYLDPTVAFMAEGAQIVRVPASISSSNDYYIVLDRSATVMATEAESVGVRRPATASAADVRARLLAMIAGATGKPGGQFAKGGGRVPGEGIRKLGADIEARARSIEPQVTATISGVVTEQGGRMAGLEFRVKTAESLARKIDVKSKQSGQLPEATADRITDSLRYTAVLSEGEYSSTVQSTMRTLEDSGFAVTELETHWQRGDAYNGVHLIARHSNGSAIELQFHTEASLAAKMATHPIYEQVRVSSDPVKRRSLTAEMVRLADAAPIPDGALTLGTLVHRPVDD